MSSFDEKILSIVNSMSASIPTNPFKNKWISILGDAMSTYEGWQTTSGFNYPFDTVNDVSKTWWHQLLTKLEANLCVNYSTNDHYLNRYCTDEGCANIKLHREEGTEYMNLNGTKVMAPFRQDPDVILVSLGTEDFEEGRNLGETYANPYSEVEETFIGGYIKMLYTILKNYPNAKVYCLTPAQYGRNRKGFGPNGSGKFFFEFVETVERIARMFSLPCIHADEAGYNNVITGDYITRVTDHFGVPQANAMEMIANKCYKELMNK